MNIIIVLILIFASTFCGCYITYRYFQPQLKEVQQLNLNTAKQNEEIAETNKHLLAEFHDLEKEKINLKSYNNQLNIEKEKVQEQIESLNNNIKIIEKQAQEAADVFYESKMQIAQNNLEKSLAEENQKYQENINSFLGEYDNVVSDYLQDLKDLTEKVKIMQSTHAAAVEAAKRAEEMKDKLYYYRIQLSAADIKEIEMLRSIEPYLRDKEPLNKVIWKCYYEKPTADLIGRVVGSGVKTGIYKITEIETQKCYVGQAVKFGR